MSTDRRLRQELQIWRMTWQQLETFLDRLEGAREDDATNAWTAACCYEALDQVEALRCRRKGYRLTRDMGFAPPPYVPDADDAPDDDIDPWTPLRQGFNGLVTKHDDAQKRLPDALDVELAAAPLNVDDEDGKSKNPPTVRVIASEYLLTVWSDKAGGFVDVHAPDYDFGRYVPSNPSSHPLFPALFPLLQEDIEIGKDDTLEIEAGKEDEVDVGLYCLPRRKMAADEGFAPTRPWSEVHETRRKALADKDSEWEDSRGQTPFVDDVVADLTANPDAASQALNQWADEADAGAAHLARVLARAEHEELDDEVLTAIEGLAGRLTTERDSLRAMAADLDDGAEADAIEDLFDALPAPDDGDTDEHVQALRDAIDGALAARLTVPDGSIRQARALEGALLRWWRARKHWFPHREIWLYRPLLARFLRPFVDALEALLAGVATVPGGWEEEQVARAVAAGSEELRITEADGARRLRRQRPGRLALVGGPRPTAAIVLRGKRLPRNADGVRVLGLLTLPLRTSIQSGLGLDGVPGLIAEGAPLVRTLRHLDGPSLVRGHFSDEPEADGLLHAAVALWGQLAMILGAAAAPTLPSPFDRTLRLPVHATDTVPLAAGAPILVLPTAFPDGAADEDGPLFGSPGERFLLTGRTAEGSWIQAVVEVAMAVVTTMEALEVDPETDPNSPICCTTTTPVVALQLARNTMPEALVGDVWLSRDFLGFGCSLAVGTQLPTEIDGSDQIQVIDDGGLVRFEVVDPKHPIPRPGGAVWVDRGPELAAAAQVIERWVRPA